MVHLLTTKDCVHYNPEIATGIVGGTGSVIKADGVYHLYYCIFESNPQRQYVCHATSTDLKSWTKYPEETFGPDESIYLLTDWRDPHVIWNEEEKCWWMLLCAQSQGNTKRRGCVGLCKSTDLHHWTCCAPLYSPQSSMSAYECPDIFYMNGWWYLVFSQFTDRFQTLYRMSRSCNGPWIRPKTDSFDGRAFYAAKTCSDGDIVIFLDGIQQEHKIRGILIQIRHMRGMIIKRMIGAEVLFHMKFMQEKMEHWQFGQIQH